MAVIDPSRFPSNNKFVGNNPRPNSGPSQSPPPPNNRRGNIPRQKQVISNNSLASRRGSLFDEFKDSLISKDRIDLGSYLVRDVIVPTIQNTILDYLSMKFFGTSQMVRPRANYGKTLFDYGRQAFNYGGQYQNNYNYGRSTGYPNAQQNNTRNSVDYRNIVLLTPDDAKAVVDNLRGRIYRFNEATVSDLYDAIGVTASYVDDDWGWTNANDIGIKRVPEGWLIDVAEARYLAR